MPREKNKALRVIVPLVAAAAAVGVVAAVYVSSMRQAAGPSGGGGGGGAGAGQSATAPAETAPAPDGAAPPQDMVAASNGAEPSAPAVEPVGGAEGEKAPADSPALTAGPGAEEEAAAKSPAGSGAAPLLRARVHPVDGSAPSPAPIGAVGANGEGVDNASPFTMRIDFTLGGAGVEAITLSRYFETAMQRPGEEYRIQRRQSYTDHNGRKVSVASLGVVGVEIRRGPGSAAAPESPGVFIDLRQSAEGALWRETAPGAFEAVIVDASDEPVARIERRYSLSPDSYDIEVSQRLENLTDEPMTALWYQYGSVDLSEDEGSYGMDKRRLRFGFLLNPQEDPSRGFVQANDGIISRSEVVDDALKSGNLTARVWPTREAERRGHELSWAAMTNRYFAFAAHPRVDVDALQAGQPVDRTLRQAGEVYGVLLGPRGAAPLILQLNSPAPGMEIGPGGSLDLSMGAYAGPVWRKTLKSDPALQAVRLDRLIMFNFGGPCAFCTFQWLAHGLLFFLGFVHDYLVFDWAIAIMILVVCVRGALHPVTRRSQIGMMRFSRQMQAVAPKQQKLREKFKDDPKRLQQETLKLYREEGVQFRGMLGCLPMFLQSPVWIALYAMLFFTFDLRHEAAFYGVFQSASTALTGSPWWFLADLSAPDRFIYFGRVLFTVPLLGPIESVNLLPLLLGFVFFVQQKYLTPPPTTALTPEQAQQQKIMKVMMVVMFPLIMYTAPSGLAIYFITNSALGIIESRYIRSHVDKMELEPKRPPAERKRVDNAAARFKKRREREGSPWKKRD